MTALAIRFDLRNPEFAGVSTADRYQAALEMSEWADRLGFDAVILSEHHGSDDGYLPSIFPMAAAIAARTDNVQIRLAAVVAPLHDPLRVAEDAVAVDQISRGRLMVVVTNGYVASEFEAFGVDLKDRPKLVERTVHTLRKAWTGEPFDHDGRTARVTPRPYQDGGPPLELGGSTPAAARRAARLGVGFFPALTELWEPYREECVKLGRPDPGQGAPIPPLGIHCANDPDEAWAQVGPFALHEMNAYGKWAAEAEAATGYTPMEDTDMLRSFNLYLMMTPDEMVEHAKQTGYLLFHPMMGGTPPNVAWESLRLFESDVLPRIR
ncbi:MAG TPA: LLM class flavin-dependent oxidoreductase [Ilumatobacteraceae bacterium]|nr:LLM class flavin-dependent oxidoreductase [Ilumatobacteraceae bacterium]